MRCLILICGIILSSDADDTISRHDVKNRDSSVSTQAKFAFNNVVDMQALEYILKFVQKAKAIIDNDKVLKQNSSRKSHKNFTDFIRDVAEVLVKYDDRDLKYFFAVCNDELKTYRFRSRKTDLPGSVHLRTYTDHILEAVRKKSAAVIRSNLKAIIKKMKKKKYDENEIRLIDYLNFLHQEDSENTLKTFLDNIDEYGLRNKSKENLEAIIRNGIRFVFFGQKPMSDQNARSDLRSDIDKYLNYFLELWASLILILKESLASENDKKNTDSAGVSIQSKLETASKSTKALRTLRQMYVERNLDLKHDPYFHKHLTTDAESKTKKRIRSNKIKVKNFKVNYEKLPKHKSSDHHKTKMLSNRGMKKPHKGSKRKKKEEKAIDSHSEHEFRQPLSKFSFKQHRHVRRPLKSKMHAARYESKEDIREKAHESGEKRDKYIVYKKDRTYLEIVTMRPYVSRRVVTSKKYKYEVHLKSHEPQENEPELNLKKPEFQLRISETPLRRKFDR